MKNILSSFVIAISMYSKVPMPRINFENSRMKYVMIFFPLVGVLIGGCVFAMYAISCNFSMSPLLLGGIITVIPILITGGIHFDGYMDTVDAISSYQERERKLEILKDPHVGAFGVIYAIVFVVAFFAGVCGMKQTFQSYFAICLAFVLSRCLSGICACNLDSANSGSLSAFKNASGKIVCNICLMVMIFAVGASLAIFAGLFGICVFAVQIIWAFVYKIRMYKIFGGITGDTAGYFLLVSELLSVLMVATLGVIL